MRCSLVPLLALAFVVAMVPSCVRALLPQQTTTLVPGSPAPPFVVSTLDGQFEFDPKAQRKGPLLVFAYNSHDAFSRTMWTTDAYLDDFLLNATLTRYSASLPSSRWA